MTEASSAQTRPFSSVARWGVLVTLVFVYFHGQYLAKTYSPNKWLFGDGSFYLVTVRAVAEHGRLEQRDLQPQSWYAQDLGWNRSLTDDWSNVALGRNGGWYPKHPILVPLVGVPFYLLYGTLGTLIANVLMNYLFILLVFLLGRRFTRVWVAALAACATAAVPFVQEMSYSFSNDLLGADLILGALECSFAGRFGLAGVLTGFSIWSRVTNGAFLPALAVVGFELGGWRAVKRAVLFSLLPLGVFGALNTYCFGAPWITSYQSVLVREGGVAKTASHSRLFNVPLAEGLRRLILGQDGGFRTFPLLAPGLLGLLAIGWRRRLLFFGFILFVALPFLVFAKYDWYRPHFLYPVYGLGGVGLAALVGLFLKPVADEGPILSRGWVMALATTVVVALVGGAAIHHHLTHPDPSLLSSHMKEAEVRLDEIPCDYWNPQVERWECSYYDRGGGWVMTGRMMEPENVKGTPRSAIWMHPNPSRRWRRVLFHTLDAHRVDLSFALGDESRAGPVEIEVIPRGHDPIKLELSKPGEELQRSVEIAAGSGAALELRTRSQLPDWKHLIVEGHLSN